MNAPLIADTLPFRIVRPAIRLFTGWLPFFPLGVRKALLLGLALSVASAVGVARGNEAAWTAITSAELARHINVLADDTFEGREAGSRGGRASGVYIGQELRKLGLAGAGTNGGYYQAFGNQYRNILAILPGADSTLANECVLVCAHYDHVGYGTASNSYGPTGYIHNGADDNASGVAGLLELARALSSAPERPRRSIVVAFWDAEEKGLLGSKHWIRSPTLPLGRIKAVVNMDMIGRMKKERLEVAGSRTSYGLRRLVSQANTEATHIDFTWDMRADSDHHPFFQHEIPALLFHTGLHEDYHRPSDDSHKINLPDTEQVVRLMAGVIHELATIDKLSGFRAASRTESSGTHAMRFRPLAPLPGRLGVSWSPSDDGQPGVIVKSVNSGSSAARSGVRPGDVILALAGSQVTESTLRQAVLAAEPQTIMSVSKNGQGPTDIPVTLAGSQVRVGISWRTDDAEPDTVVISRVVPDSPASRAGLVVNDRINLVNGSAFRGSAEFVALLGAGPARLELTTERQGRILQVTFDVP